MLFNSFSFLFVFLPAVLLGWWVLFKKPEARIAFIVLASYAFYGFFDFPMGFKLLPGVIFSTVLNYWIARLMSRRSGSGVLYLGVAVNLALLGYFKYLGLFERTLNDLGGILGHGPWVTVHHILLPLGISFYTFNSMSYIIDVSRKTVEPEESFIRFAAFVSLFPHLLVGPIVRYGDLREQLRAPATKLDASLASTGIYFVACGLFKKVVIADAIAPHVTRILHSPESLTLVSSWVGMIAYSLQLYFDFSGYSEVAYGLAMLLGFSFPQNFNSPYKSASVAGFWQRWHMSLSLWFRDYVSQPIVWRLMKKRGPRAMLSNMIIAAIVTMALCGFWHGAEWVFLFYGVGHGLLISVNYLARKYGIHTGSEVAARALTYVSVVLMYVVFVSPDMKASWLTWKAMFGANGLGIQSIGFDFLTRNVWKIVSAPFSPGTAEMNALFVIFVAVLLVFVNFAPNLFEFRHKRPVLGGVVLGLQMAICLLFLSGAKPFLYLQF